MKLARVAVLGVAVGAGLVAAVIAMNFVRQPPPPAPVVVQAPAPEPVPATQVLVAAVDIPIGTTISADAIEWRDWPASGISEQFIKREAGTDQMELAVGAIARASLYAGEPITDGKLIRTDQGYMAAILPAGMRAVATGISVLTSAGGFILPNDRVDVLMVRQNSRTEVILSNIRVLAIDQTIEDKGGKKVVVGQTATLELTPRQAKILATAQPIADRLMLALRSIADSKAEPGDQDLDAVYLIDGSKRAGVVTVVRNGVARDVRSIRGATDTEDEIGAGDEGGTE
jgi:pilus assembly protein CpaB